MARSPLLQQIDSLPELPATMIDDLVRQTAEILPEARCQEIQRVYLTGCGDSHHAGVNAELAFEQFAGLPCRAATAMQFGRYLAPTLERNRPGALVVGVSASGAVSRTIEALDLARQGGALTVAVTGHGQSPLASVAELVLPAATPPFPYAPKGLIVPGARSYIASQLALFVLAVHLGQARGQLPRSDARRLLQELAAMADLMETTIARSDPVAGTAARAWQEEDSSVFCGSGPNYGTALFSAAKVLEASGDSATGQDMEEWAHLEYFARRRSTPTFLISAGQRDQVRALEIAKAAKTISRRVAIVAPLSSALAHTADQDVLFPLADGAREAFSPLISCLPGLLFAAYRADVINEVYFRDFGGGRSIKGGGGVSRIRNSHRWDKLPS
jgi:glucosamine--fructose-6-phosphate aminotransferase (isomerizing)